MTYSKFRPRHHEPRASLLDQISTLEDERGLLWRQGVATEAQRVRLAEINRKLSALWRRRREEMSAGRQL